MWYTEEITKGSGLNAKDIQELKKILQDHYKREPTQIEINTAISSLRILAEISCDAILEESERQKLLAENPNGYHLKNGGTCIICGNHAKSENTWFDKHGLKCIYCQKALNKKILPISITKDHNKDSWYTTFDLESYFNLGKFDLKKCIKASFFKVRTVLNDDNKIHLQVFLVKDNKDVLPPKKLLESRMTKVIFNDKEYYTTEQWYDYFTDAQVEKLVKYRIFECLPYTLSKPLLGGRFLIPVGGLNPLFHFKNFKEEKRSF